MYDGYRIDTMASQNCGLPKKLFWSYFTDKFQTSCKSYIILKLVNIETDRL